jgi:hypothetical protein
MTIAEVERTAKYLRDGNMLQRCPAGAMEVLRQDLQSAGLREAAELLRRFVSCYCDLAAERTLLLESLQEAARSDYEAEMSWRRQVEESEDNLAEAREEARNEGLELLHRGVR